MNYDGQNLYRWIGNYSYIEKKALINSKGIAVATLLAPKTLFRISRNIFIDHSIIKVIESIEASFLLLLNFLHRTVAMSDDTAAFRYSH